MTLNSRNPGEKITCIRPATSFVGVLNHCSHRKGKIVLSLCVLYERQQSVWISWLLNHVQETTCCAQTPRFFGWCWIFRCLQINIQSLGGIRIIIQWPFTWRLGYLVLSLLSSYTRNKRYGKIYILWYTKCLEEIFRGQVYRIVVGECLNEYVVSVHRLPIIQFAFFKY